MDTNKHPHLVDTHCHLYDAAFDADRDAAIQRAVEAGVTTLILPAIDSASLAAQEHLAAAYPQYCHQMMGLHPTSVTADYEAELALVRHKLFATCSEKQQPTPKWLQVLPGGSCPLTAPSPTSTAPAPINGSRSHLVAVGEIGLDLYWDKTFLPQQLEVLRQQILWARELSLPVCLHVRKAYNELFGLLRDLNFGTYSGVMHCFGGSVQEAHKAVEMGFHIGVGGVVTFKNATLAEVAAAVPLDRILLETDCPYLSPVPHRGQRNESAYIPLIAQKIADLRGITFDEVAETTTASAYQLFSL